jgi:hypothetical protein
MSALLPFLAPEPVSPLFRAGGALHGFNEDITLTAAALAVLFLADAMLIKPFLQPKSRWFAVHTLGNAIVSVAAFPELAQTLADPLNAFVGPMATMVPNSTVRCVFPSRHRRDRGPARLYVLICWTKSAAPSTCTMSSSSSSDPTRRFTT